jgi:hypothetical protein
MADNLVKIFLSSPSDVVEERRKMAELTAEINDVLAYLAPERGLKLELLRYEVDAYPDYGAPQDVVNRIIPNDFDIFVGIMWKCCGTKTATAESGTIQEYRSAVQRRERTGKPIIMFYLCNAPLPFPTSEDVEQLKKAVEFREQLEKEGLTQTYPSPESFREYVRGDLLKAVRDLASNVDTTATKAVEREQIALTTPAEKAAMSAQCEAYNAIREQMRPSPERTSKMAEIFATMRSLAGAVRWTYPEFKEGQSGGERLAAVAILQMFPNNDELDWLAKRLDHQQESRFLGYQAAQALLQAARGLPASKNLVEAVNLALQLVRRDSSDADRIKILETARETLERKRPNAATPEG